MAAAAAAAARHIAIFINIHKLKCSRKVFCILIIDGTHDVISFQSFYLSASFSSFSSSACRFFHWLNLKPHFSGRRAYYEHILFRFFLVFFKKCVVRSSGVLARKQKTLKKIYELIFFWCGWLCACVRTERAHNEHTNYNALHMKMNVLNSLNAGIDARTRERDQNI